MLSKTWSAHLLIIIINTIHMLCSTLGSSKRPGVVEASKEDGRGGAIPATVEGIKVKGKAKPLSDSILAVPLGTTLDG